MRRIRELGALLLATLAPPTVAACATPDQADVACAHGDCMMHLHSGKSLSIDGQRFYVKDVGDDTVKLSTHGVTFTLSRKLDLRLGGYQLHLARTANGTADIRVLR